MAPEFHRHVDADVLERYSIGNTPAEEAAHLEEHLLVCESCRQRLVQTEQYLASMSRAAAKLRRRSPARSSWDLMRVLRSLAVAACVIVVASLALRWFGSQPKMATVNLVATRGSAAESIAPAGRPLRLHPDLTGLSPSPSYLMEVVDRDGGRIWLGALIPPHDAVTVPRQTVGTYFVRIYAPGGDLLREYGLEIR